jgi:hypothetical protein
LTPGLKSFLYIDNNLISSYLIQGCVHNGSLLSEMSVTMMVAALASIQFDHFFMLPHCPGS